MALDNLVLASSRAPGRSRTGCGLPALPRHPLPGALGGAEAGRGHSCEMVSWQVNSWPQAAGTPRDSTLAGWMMLTVHTYISARTEISFLFNLPSL